MVEFFSAAIVLRVCKYRSWRAEGDWAMMSAASLSARAAFCSPSAANTYYVKRLQCYYLFTYHLKIFYFICVLTIKRFSS